MGAKATPKPKPKPPPPKPKPPKSPPPKGQPAKGKPPKGKPPKDKAPKGKPLKVLPPKPEDPVTCNEKVKLFLTVHWRGLFTMIVPFILIPVILPFPGKAWQWVSYCLGIMASYWVTECIPLQITAFIPLLIFPITNVANTNQTSKSYMNDTNMMFLGSLMLAASVEQSGFHKRLAYCAVRNVGYSHVKLLLAMCIVTTFVSMWIQNTAATVMMIPIIFALLNVFEESKIMTLYKKNADGDEVATPLTTCYFCAAAYSASVGGIGTLVGTGTNLVFKGLYASANPAAPEYLSFPKFSCFGVPTMIALEIFVYLYLAVVYLGLFRPRSKAAKDAVIPFLIMAKAKAAIEKDSKSLGKLSYWEFMVILLFGGAMVAFFCRSPQIFIGWGDFLEAYFRTGPKFIKDSSLAMLITTLMLLLPSNLSFFKNFSAKYMEDMPNKPIRSVLDWFDLNKSLPYSFMFLLGGGFALSDAAKTSGLNLKIGMAMAGLKNLPNPVVILLVIICVIFFTNFASNVAVCNVFAPIAMSVAMSTGRNQLWYCITAGFTASFCFMLPVGTPPNLIVQSAAKVSTSAMIKAGFGPTISTIIIFWLMVYFYAPIVWPIMLL